MAKGAEPIELSATTVTSSQDNCITYSELKQTKKSEAADANERDEV